MMKRDECLKALARHLTDEVVVATYQAAFDWMVIRPSPLNYLSIGAMGLASSHALGLALGRPDRRIIVLDGDGSLLMNLGSLVSIAEAKPRNLIHCVCENGTYEANGAHPIPGQDRVSFTGFAKAAGYPVCHEFSELRDFEARIASVLRQEGPVFVDLKIMPGAPSPQDYPYIHGAATREAFRKALRES
ncbi:MAG: thiamine pyrophosphate-binding protein [Alphaproteobacteria bacterium]|nr:thiamine pyrophosphate-binding protein [Alphaproteobacteria bacterium]